MTNRAFTHSISLLHSKTRNAKLLVFLVHCIVCVALACIFQSRAFVAGYLTSSTFFYLYIRPVKLSHQKKYVVAAVIVLAMLLLCFGIKRDSSSGRLFIYKISSRIVREHFVNGVGWGNFDVIYGNYQAAYFRNGNYSTKELLLADNTRHAFNDYLQFFIETGLIGLIALLAGFILIISIVHKAFRKNKPPDFLLSVAATQLLAISVAALFDHVFEKLFFQLLFTASLIIILFYSFRKWPRMFLIGGLVILLAITWMSSGFYIQNHSNFKKMEAAGELLRMGYIREAYEGLQPLYTRMNSNEEYLNIYIQVLMTRNEYVKAAIVLQDLLRIRNTSFYWTLLGDCHYHNKEPEKAEAAYLMAVNLVPNKFTSRLSLFEFYFTTGQREKTIACGAAILHLPVKIPSARVTAARQHVTDRLKGL